MKKIIVLLSTMMLSLSAFSAQFNEGTHYTVLNQDKSAKPVVNEFFSFYCPHCFNFEPLVAGLKESLPADTKFQKSHVSFMGGNMGISMSKAYAAMISLKVEDTMVPVMFNRIHNQGNAPQNDDELRQIFTDEGIEAKKFDAAFSGFAVDSMVRRFDKEFQKAGLRGVPAFIVNNKYQVDISSISSGAEFNELINYLLEL